jgi:hypothetical protein
MSMSAGMSSSQSQSNATKQSTGPVAFGSVNIAPVAAAGSSWLWPVLASAAASALIFILFRKK